MSDFNKELAEFIYKDNCPGQLQLHEFNVKEGCTQGISEIDFEVCKKCWKMAIDDYNFKGEGIE